MRHISQIMTYLKNIMRLPCIYATGKHVHVQQLLT